MDPSYKSSIVKARIGGEIIDIDLASSQLTGYDIPNFTYLGAGVYYSIDGVPSSDNRLYHFWKNGKNKVQNKKPKVKPNLYLVTYSLDDEWELSEGVVIVCSLSKRLARKLAVKKIGPRHDITEIKLLSASKQRVLFFKSPVIE